MYDKEINVLMEQCNSLRAESMRNRAHLEGLKNKCKLMQIELIVCEVALVVLAFLHILGK